MKKFISIFLAAAVILTFCACGGKNQDDITTTIDSGFEVSEADKTSLDSSSPSKNGSQEAPSEGESTTAEEEKIPQTVQEVIEAYKTVMNQAKKDKPGFTRLDYQDLPSDPENRVISSGEGLINPALALAGNFMKSKKQAEKKPTIGEKGGNMADFPVKNTNYGCLLKGTEGVKSAKCEKLNNGYYKITIVMNDEKNPEPAAPGATSAPSYMGSICSPISKAEIDADLATGLFKDISYSLTYHDCETVLIYNPENNHIYSQVQTNRVTIQGKGTIGLVTLNIEKQELINHVDIINLKY